MSLDCGRSRTGPLDPLDQRQRFALLSESGLDRRPRLVLWNATNWSQILRYYFSSLDAFKEVVFAFDPSHPSTLLDRKDRHIAPIHTSPKVFWFERLPAQVGCQARVVRRSQISAR